MSHYFDYDVIELYFPGEFNYKHKTKLGGKVKEIETIQNIKKFFKWGI